MRVEERDDITQHFIRTQAKVKELKRDFNDLIELIDGYKTLIINAQIEELKTEKAKKWWEILK